MDTKNKKPIVEMEEESSGAYREILTGKTKKVSKAGRKKSETHLDHKIMIRMDDELFEYIQQKAKYNRQPMSNFVISAVLEKMRSETETKSN